MLKVRATQLGGSELQRVAIGRTLVTRPALLLLDEPLSNLETEMRSTMRRELRRLQKEIGLTIIYVTHDQIEALSLAQQIAVMSNGKLRQCDRTHVVYEQPAHTFVAGFIGEPPMNLINGTVSTSDAKTEFVAGQLRLAIGGRPALDRPRVVLGVRPDAIRVTAPSPERPEAIIRRVEPRGGEAVVVADLDGTRLEAVVPTRSCPAEGARVSLDFDLERLALFDADTQTNVLERAS